MGKFNYIREYMLWQLHMSTWHKYPVSLYISIIYLSTHFLPYVPPQNLVPMKEYEGQLISFRSFTIFTLQNIIYNPMKINFFFCSLNSIRLGYFYWWIFNVIYKDIFPLKLLSHTLWLEYILKWIVTNT